MSLHDILLAKALGGGSGGASSFDDLCMSENAVLLPKTQFVSGYVTGALAAPGKSVELVEGRTYTVNWNGVDYETVCFMGVSPIDGTNMLGLGNPMAVGGANNNQPFVIGGNAQAIAAITLDGSTSATVSIKGYGVGTIPKQYLPETRHDICVDMAAFDGGNAAIMDYNTTELVDVLLSNGSVYLQLKSAGNMVVRVAVNVVTCWAGYAGETTLENIIQRFVAQNGKQSVPLLLMGYYTNNAYVVELNMSGIT